MPHTAEPGVARLIQRLDEASLAPDVATICAAVKRALCEEVVQHGLRLPAHFVTAIPDRYARRLLYRAPDRRYTVVVMAWGAGQTTPIHDHAGKWCVECVYDGRITVTSFALLGEASAEQVRFRREEEIHAGVGEAGALIPPFEYHRIANPDARTAVTIHVYGGEMDGCHVFQPQDDGSYTRRWCELCYADA